MSDLSTKSDLVLKDQVLNGLLAKVAQGDEDALGALYDRTSSQVYGLALRILDDPAMAEEVTLDVFMQVWKKASQFDQSRGKAIVWLAVLTRSRAIDRLRANPAAMAGQETLDVVKEIRDPSNDPELSTFESEQRNLVQRALGSLSPEQRQAIELAYFGGYSQSEIAKKVGEPLGTVKTRIRLGMIKLRNYLGPFQEGLAS